MKTAMFVFVLFLFIASNVFGQSVAEKMSQNLIDMAKAHELAMQTAIEKQQENLIKQLNAKKIPIMVFFSEALEPDKVIEKLGLRENENTLGYVLNAYKENTQRQFHWLKEFSKSRDVQKEMADLRIHELSQAASLKASFSAMKELAQQPNIKKICLYSQELTKPDSYFLKPEYYKIQNVSITPIENGYEKDVQGLDIRNTSEREITPEQIINILKKVFEYIKENKPVVNTSVDMACAVPKGIQTWQEMASWREKHTGQYSIKYVNGFGITVVEIVVRAHFYYNGNYNGVGKYITCATSTIDTLNVLWGYTLNASANIPDSGIVNLGTTENPIAGMKLFIHWVVDTILQHQEGRLTFSLDGQGNASAY